MKTVVRLVTEADIRAATYLQYRLVLSYYEGLLFLENIYTENPTQVHETINGNCYTILTRISRTSNQAGW